MGWRKGRHTQEQKVASGSCQRLQCPRQLLSRLFDTLTLQINNDGVGHLLPQGRKSLLRLIRYTTKNTRLSLNYRNCLANVSMDSFIHSFGYSLSTRVMTIRGGPVSVLERTDMYTDKLQRKAVSPTTETPSRRRQAG